MMITTNIPKKHMPETLYEVLQANNYNGIDICDEDWDSMVFFECPESWEEAGDSYDKFMLLLALNLRIVYNTNNPAAEIRELADLSDFGCCNIGTFMWENRDIFDPFFNERNSSGHRPKDYKKLDPESDSGFYEVYMMPFESLVVGNYSEKDYVRLYDAFVAKAAAQAAQEGERGDQ